jgi:hypothetical protein
MATALQLDPSHPNSSETPARPTTVPTAITTERTPEAVDRCEVGNSSAPNAASVTSVPIIEKMSRIQSAGAKIPAAI